jgi:hypothetical protein
MVFLHRAIRASWQPKQKALAVLARAFEYWPGTTQLRNNILQIGKVALTQPPKIYPRNTMLNAKSVQKNDKCGQTM